jgi:hypothetical protein
MTILLTQSMLMPDAEHSTAHRNVFGLNLTWVIFRTGRLMNLIHDAASIIGIKSLRNAATIPWQAETCMLSIQQIAFFPEITQMALNKLHTHRFQKTNVIIFSAHHSPGKGSFEGFSRSSDGIAGPRTPLL